MSDLRELRRLEPWFFLAPSAHNTQPWVLAYGRDRVELGFDLQRHLHASDPMRRDLLLALGAFAECVLVAAADAGTPLAFEPRVEGMRVGTFVRATAYETRFRRSDLERRQTSRLRYAPTPVDAAALAAARAQLAPHERLHEAAADDVVELFARADRHLYENAAAVGELRAWLRLDRRHRAYRRDGLGYECLGLSRLEARALDLALRPHVLPLARPALTASARRVLGGGSVLVLESAADADEDVLLAGRSLLRVWLALARHGHRTHPLSQILDCAATARELGDRVGADPRRLLSVFRAGRSADPPRSGRLVSTTAR